MKKPSFKQGNWIKFADYKSNNFCQSYLVVTDYEKENKDTIYDYIGIIKDGKEETHFSYRFKLDLKKMRIEKLKELNNYSYLCKK